VTATKERKQEIVKAYRLHDTDTGSPEVQIALLSARINEVTQHLEGHKRDFSTRRGLLKMVGQRRRLLNYLRDTDIEAYRALLDNLNLRK
jgi:small subunit ribosomal protein S15